MRKMHFTVLMLMAALYGCQRGTPAQQIQPLAAAPAAPLAASEVPAVLPAPPAAQPVVSNQPAQVAQPAPVAAPKPVVAAPKPMAPAPVVAKPEVKAEAVLSDADGRKLAQKSGCFACHAIDKKVVGPAWKDIAAKYRGQPNVEAKLIDKIAKGGSGVWGNSPMPPNAPRVSADDTRALVRFILSLK